MESTAQLNTSSSVTLAPEVSDFCRRAVEALCAKLPVREVWLFGSHAYGKPTEDSDVDLLVIVEQSTLSKFVRMKNIRKRLGKYNFNFSKDVFVYTLEEIEEWKNVSQAFVTTALNEGKIMYENKS